MSPVDHSSFLPNPTHLMRVIVSEWPQTKEETNFNASTFSARIQLVPEKCRLSQISPTACDMHTQLLSHTMQQQACMSQSQHCSVASLSFSDTSHEALDYRARKRFPQRPVVGGIPHPEAPPYLLLLLRKELSLFSSHIGLSSGEQKFERSDCRIR